MDEHTDSKAQFTKDKGRPLEILGPPIETLGWPILLGCNCLGWPTEKIGQPLKVIGEMAISI